MTLFLHSSEDSSFSRRLTSRSQRLSLPCIVAIAMFSLIFAKAVAADQPWRVEVNDGEAYLVEVAKGVDSQRFPITYTSPGIRFIKSFQANPNIDVLIYFSGAAGTSVIVDIEYALLIDRESGKLIADLPWRYQDSSGEKYFTQPQWSFFSDKIEVRDEQSGLRKTITW